MSKKSNVTKALYYLELAIDDPIDLDCADIERIRHYLRISRSYTRLAKRALTRKGSAKS